MQQAHEEELKVAEVNATAQRLQVNYLESALASSRSELQTVRASLREAEATSTQLGMLQDSFDAWTEAISEPPADAPALPLPHLLENLGNADALNDAEIPIAHSPLLPLMIAERPKTVAEALAFTLAPIILTTAAYPFRIVHTNGAWAALCGWQSHEVLGSTCALLQGKSTNRAHTVEMCKSARKTGYAAAELINYKKDGTPFLNRIVLIPVVSQSTGGPKLTNTVGILDGSPLPPAVLAASSDPQHPSRLAERPMVPPLDPHRSAHDALLGSLAFDDLPRQPASLSVALEYMAMSSEPLVLTDSVGRICSANRPWVELCGYTCSEIEGHTCRILQGGDTDPGAVAALNAKVRRGERAEATVINYKKGARRFVNHVTILPLFSARVAASIGRSTAGAITGTLSSNTSSSCCHFIARLREVVEVQAHGALEHHHLKGGDR